MGHEGGPLRAECKPDPPIEREQPMHADHRQELRLRQQCHDHTEPRLRRRRRVGRGRRLQARAMSAGRRAVHPALFGTAMRAWRARQGLAAMEFAMTVPVLVILLSGVISLGAVMWAKMQV